MFFKGGHIAGQKVQTQEREKPSTCKQKLTAYKIEPISGIQQEFLHLQLIPAFLETFLIFIETPPFSLQTDFRKIRMERFCFMQPQNLLLS